MSTTLTRGVDWWVWLTQGCFFEPVTGKMCLCVVGTIFHEENAINNSKIVAVL